MISIIVAHDNNRAIGAGNQLLWHISEDLKCATATGSRHRSLCYCHVLR